MRNVVIIGAGSKAEHLCDLFEMRSKIIQFYDKPRSEHEEKQGVPVSNRFMGEPDRLYVVYSAIGDARPKRDRIIEFTEEMELRNLRYKWGRLVHCSSIMTNLRQIGEDFVLRELSSLGTQVKIGDHVSIGPLANISHHSSIGNYTTICGQAAISGGVSIGEGVFVGQGAAIKPNITIGDGAVIGTGAVVVKDVAPNTVIAGNPADTNEKFIVVESW